MDGLAGTKGGSGVWQRIISEMPLHDVFIEAFWGRGTITRKKRPAAITIGIDRDPDAVSHGRDVALMFHGCGIQWTKDYFQMSLGDDTESYVPRVPTNPATAAGAAESRAPAETPNLAADVVGSGDAGSCVPVRNATFGGASWRRHFVYFDPPYLGCEGYYKHELTLEQHVDLCRLFRALPCPAALSGYRTDVHDAELSGCRSISYWTVKRSGERIREHLWMNYPKPAVFHDARFVGADRRQRERIRRRVANWSAGLEQMSADERQAVWEACDAVYRGLAGHKTE